MKSIVKNRKAYHDYFIEEKFEAGISLMGSEVKSLRDGHGSLVDAYALVRDGGVWMQGFFIPRFKQASYNNHEEKRDRRLLLKASEIKRLFDAQRKAGYSIIPLEVYFNERNLVKVRIALAKGKAKYDKRDASKEADAKREIARTVRR